MKNKNSKKTYPIHVEAGLVSAQNYRGINNIHGTTLIALVITSLFSYDEKLKCSNSKGFLLQTI